ncbi:MULTISPECIES: hypothetical protein [Aeromonas]|uniref:hypothetical protein n=1 Tax=Aeromonas TaxID=642 RepID=UPI000A6106FF|nr:MULTISPECIES: hypothetical protein [Aeromonas]EIS3742422.1 hypothetical protein [Aeromonas hydrophila]ELA9381280.1 hypothetical protein [Aeromonas hydrophila]MBW3834187.1 hypothetical protein [Aeromonas hydrophila]MBW5266404.1 hypothetical protein [Aeromonas hydrophila]MBW5279579.1 hypothetical protein [Aeromonas hydrophila]
MTGHSSVMPINSVIGDNLDVSVQPLVVGFGLLLVFCLLVTLYGLLVALWEKQI